MIEKNEMIFGVRAVIEAIQAGKEIDKVLVKKDIQSELSKELFAALKDTQIPVHRVPVERINKITRKNHQGVVAFISPITYQKTEDIVPFLLGLQLIESVFIRHRDLGPVGNDDTRDPLPVASHYPVYGSSGIRGEIQTFYKINQDFAFGFFLIAPLDKDFISPLFDIETDSELC